LLLALIGLLRRLLDDGVRLLLLLLLVKAWGLQRCQLQSLRARDS
jgi:hypothetical protein